MRLYVTLQSRADSWPSWRRQEGNSRLTQRRRVAERRRMRRSPSSPVPWHGHLAHDSSRARRPRHKGVVRLLPFSPSLRLCVKVSPPFPSHRNTAAPFFREALDFALPPGENSQYSPRTRETVFLPFPALDSTIEKEATMHCRPQALLLPAIFLTALTQPALLKAAPKSVTFSQSAPVVEAYDFAEVTLNVERPDARNPFTDVVVEGSFQREGGRSIRVVGFCDSQDGSLFRIRFMPDELGKYSFSVNYRQGSFEKSHKGTFRAKEGKRRGILRLDKKYPWHFVWEGTGEHYFWNGTTTYYLMGWDDETIRRSIDRLQSLKVNPRPFQHRHSQPRNGRPNLPGTH